MKGVTAEAAVKKKHLRPNPAPHRGHPYRTVWVPKLAHRVPRRRDHRRKGRCHHRRANLIHVVQAVNLQRHPQGINKIGKSTVDSNFYP